ncbi:hypothetical protein MVEG_06506 [Podila verticillata NRRL 6337]|nr:hypothetical protein MVEG_06506 [Podila verticillata NRRL 6337]
MSRDPTRVESRSNDMHSMTSPRQPLTPPSSEEGLSKIKATAMLLKAKVAGTVQKEQKLPKKIHNPYAASSTSSSSSSTSSSVSSLAGLKKESIKDMIAAREDPSLSCNKLPPPTAQRRDAVKKTLEQLQPSPPSPSSSQPAKLVIPSFSSSTSSAVEGINKRSSRRRNVGTLAPSQFSSATEGPSESSVFAPPTALDTRPNEVESRLGTTSSHSYASDTRKGVSRADKDNREGSLSPSSTRPSQQQQQQLPLLSPSTPTPAPMTCPLPLVQTKEATKISSPTSATSIGGATGPTIAQTPASTKHRTRESKDEKTTPTTPIKVATDVAQSPKSPSTPRSRSVFDRPTMSPRRHTTSSPGTSAHTFNIPFDSPPVPSYVQQPMSVVNPTLRQLQTPHIPTNLVAARIQQQEEEKRKKEELAKIPITANLRQVKKIQAILVSDDEDEDPKARRTRESSSSSASSTLSVDSTRPRAHTASHYGSYGKQRGDRNHVEPVAIPKKLADQVEHILGRKLAGKGSVLDEREKEREEEEARKAATPLPPIVRGQPRKRAMTSTHIRNLVSSWDIKVEEAKEVVSEAEKIRLFLEERSTAHAELPKSKVPVTASELLAPLPSLPPPPKTPPLGGGGHARRRESFSVDLGTSSGHKRRSQSARPSLMETRSASATHMSLTTKSKVEEDIFSPGYVSGPKSGGSSRSSSPRLTPIEEKKDVEQPEKSVSASMDTQRSGEILVNKAIVSRPRRAGVRNPTKE